MPAPRIFVSSTCYDLQEIRGNIRKYIEDFGYEPIMSEFGDIFYDFDKNVQDSCIESIKSSDMFILIIGDYYGSTYHKDGKDKDKPSSVTLKEFENAITLNKPRLIFINKFVEYDYRNYRRYLEEQYREYFSRPDASDDNVDKKKEEIKNNVDSKYPFPKKSYKYVFHFLDKIDELKTGNAYFKFESSSEIKNDLRKQWAGYLQDCLKNKEQIKNSSNIQFEKIADRLDKIENILEKIAKSSTTQSSQETSVDIDKLINFIDTEKLEKLQGHFDNIIFNILNDTENYDAYGNQYHRQRIEFTSPVTNELVEKWLDSLELFLKQYKWTKYISVKIIFASFEYVYWEDRSNIDYKWILELNNLYKNIKGNEGDKESFISSIKANFEKYIKLEDENNGDAENDLPF